jgi:predicted Fe-Mo cluster-binding NifX family protein
MKIAVSASGKDLNAPVDPRFGRCEYLLIVDTENMSVDAYPNENMNLSGGAGVKSAGFVVSKGARALLTGNCGPKAMDVFRAEKVDVYTGQDGGTVGQAVEQFKHKTLSGVEKQGPLMAMTSSGNNRETTPSIRQGQGMGGGGGRGMGGGRGLGGGCGMGRRQ